MNPGVIGVLNSKASAWQLQQRNQTGTASTAFLRWNNAGNLLIVGVTKTAASISTPTDNAGNTFVDCGAGETGSGGGGVIKLFYVANCKAFAGINTVISTGADAVHLTEWSGGKLVSPTDGTAVTSNGTSGAGATNNLTCGPVTTSANGDLIFVWIANQTGTISAGTGWTAVEGATDQPNGYWEYFIQGQSGAMAVTATDSVAGTDPYGMIACAFKRKTSS